MAARARRWLGAAAAAALLGTTAPLLPAGPAASASAIRLASQTTVVTPDGSGRGQFSISLEGLGGQSSQATVSTRLYGALSTRSGLLSAMGSAGPVGQIDETGPVPARCLGSGPGRALRLSIAVLTGGAAAPSSRPCDGSSEPTWSLPCTVGSGRCAGVYPVDVIVSEGGSQHRFTTFLTLAEGPARQPLRAATVLRLGSGSGVEAATALADGLRAGSATAVDLLISPIAARRLARSEAGRAQLARAQRGPAPRELLRSPFVPVDPGALDASGLGSQTGLQIDRGDVLLAQAGLSPSRQAGYVATSPATSTALAALGEVGIDRVLLPDSSLATPTSSTLSWGEPFTPTPGGARVTALAADSVLAAQMAAGGDPVLAAERLLADLALLHLERPSLVAPLGVVLLAPDGWRPDRAFVSTLLRGLAGNPLVAPATLSSLFTTLVPGSNGVPTARALAAQQPSAPWPAAQVGGLAAGQARVTALRGAVSDGRGEMRRLAEGYLKAESDQLSSAGRDAAIAAAGLQVDAEVAKVAIASSDITLTALKGSLPITFTKSADWSISGILGVKGDHLRFPRGHRRPVDITHPTQSLRIPVVAETTGDLAVTITLTTPSGGLVLAHQRIVVRATQTSVLAIVLTAGAALVLLAWWLRTSLKRPRRRRRS